MVSQVWEGVSRMTALAKQTTQAFLEGSVVLSPPAAGAAQSSLKGQCLQSLGLSSGRHADSKVYSLCF